MGSDPQGLTPEERCTGIVNLRSLYMWAEDDGAPRLWHDARASEMGIAVAGTVPQMGAGVP